MNALPPYIKGWCPSALRPMDSGDGLLVRVHVTGADISAAHFKAVGELARAHGNGFVDLTQRGNLQMRGVTPQSFPALIAALTDLGLVEPEKENGVGRNVICSPMTGLDGTACFDAQAMAGALEERLTRASALSALPEKFCFLIDDGGRFGLDGVSADIRLIGVAGQVAIALATSNNDFVPVAVVKISEAIEAAFKLAEVFLKLRYGGTRRMHELVETVGAVELAQAAGLTSNMRIPPLLSRATASQDVIGSHDTFIGIAAPYGRLQADQIKIIAAQASQGIRLTPWRSVLLPGGEPDSLQAFEAAGLIVSPKDPRLMIVACPGHPACASAQIDTREAAEHLAPMLADMHHKGVALHISGCRKGCAHGAAAPLTVVGRDGGFDLVQNGRADDEPCSNVLNLPQLADRLRERVSVRETI